MKDWSADYAPVESGSYTYDNDGNILSRNFIYSSSPLEEYHQLYTYQANNNKLSQVSVNDNGANATYNYSYNGIGNLVADSRTGITDIDYNHVNLPILLTKDGSQIHYRYDEKGQRLCKFAGSTIDYYLRDYNGRELAIFNLMTGRMESANIYGNGLIGKVDITYTSGTERNDHRHYFLKDHLGTIRVTIDADGDVTSAQEYYPYGAYLGNLTYNLSENNARYKFTEKERDFETGYDYFTLSAATCSMSEGGEKFANVVGEATDSKTLKRLQKESKRADNIAKKNPRTGRQTNAKAAKEALDNYGGGNTASAIKSTTTSAAKKL